MKKQQRSQSAMEYLMTYGWAILIIAIALAVLVQLGVFSTFSITPKATPGGCQVYRTQFSPPSLQGTCQGALPQYVALFNGQSSYVTITDSPINSPTAAVTVSGWFYYRQIGVNVGLIWKNSYNYILYTGEGSLVKFIIWNASNTGSQANFAESLLKLNGWNYIAGTYDGTNTILYLNGQQTGNIGTAAKFTIRDQGGDLVVGKRGDGVGSIYFNGIISNVQLYNTSLSANEVQSLYMEGIGGAPIDIQHIASWWPLNSDANDYSGNKNNGIPTNVFFTTSWTTS